MWYLYLDESGDLGFDFVNKNPSKFFTISILAISGEENNKKMIKSVKKTIKRKLNNKKHRKRIIQELKGAKTEIKIKKYFYKQASDINFGIYSITLNKRRVYERLIKNKPRIYNWVARKVLDEIPFEKNKGDRVELIIDKSMSKPEVVEFNSYIRRQLEGRISPEIILDIYHWRSYENFGIQAADVFCWGIFQKYENGNIDWLDTFKDKIKFDDQFL